MRKFKWGIIGPGGIAHVFARALAGTPQAKLQAVAGRNLQRAKDFAEQYSAPSAFDDYHQLLADPQIDVVYIATPHSHHYQIAVDCLKAGKHLLVEKSLTVNANQAFELVMLARQNSLVLQEAMWSRYMPCFATVKDWINQGDIGELQYITSQIGFAFSHLRNHRLTLRSLAGGATLDLGVYSVSCSQFLLGEQPLLVQATGHINDDGVDQNTFATMVYPSGVFSQFTCTIGAQCSNVMTIHGKKGFISLAPPFWNGTKASLHQNDKIVREQDFPHTVNGFEYQIQSTMDSIEQGRLCDPVMSHDDSIEVMQTLDEIRAQIGLSYPQEIEEF